jgi:hypothetical protein
VNDFMGMTTQQIIDALVCSNGYSDRTLHLAIKQAVERLEELDHDESIRERFCDIVPGLASKSWEDIWERVREQVQKNEKPASIAKDQEFLSNAAIQIFAAVIGSAERISLIGRSDAAICWDLAELLLSQKPV